RFLSFTFFASSSFRTNGVRCTSRSLMLMLSRFGFATSPICSMNSRRRVRCLKTTFRLKELIVGRVDVISKFVKRFDSKLYCEMHEEGKLCVFRKSQRVESYDVDGLMIDFIRPAPHFVF